MGWNYLSIPKLQRCNFIDICIQCISSVAGFSIWFILIHSGALVDLLGNDADAVVVYCERLSRSSHNLYVSLYDVWVRCWLNVMRAYQNFRKMLWRLALSLWITYMHKIHIKSCYHSYRKLSLRDRIMIACGTLSVLSLGKNVNVSSCSGRIPNKMSMKWYIVV